jgi:DNA-binding XRE family transcriptional regulator
MAKKFTRIQRDRRLTPEEAAGDAEVRRQVQEEFPPKNRNKKTQPVEIGEIVLALKEARATQGLTLAEVAQRTGIERPNLSTLENASDPNPTINTLRRYAAAVGKTIQVVLQDAPTSPKVER